MIATSLLAAALLIGCAPSNGDDPVRSDLKSSSVVTADPIAPNTADDEAAAILALESVIRSRGEDPSRLDIVRAPDADESMPLQWWTDHDSGKPYQVIVLWAKAGYQGHSNWNFLLWRETESSPWVLVDEGKS